MRKLHKYFIESVFGATGALESSDVPYDAFNSVKDKIDTLDSKTIDTQYWTLHDIAGDLTLTFPAVLFIPLIRRHIVLVDSEFVSPTTRDVYLPTANLVDGDEIVIYIKSDVLTYPVDIKGSIEGDPTGVTMDYQNSWISLKYDSGNNTWKIVGHNA